MEDLTAADYISKKKKSKGKKQSQKRSEDEKVLHANGKFSCLCSVCNEQTRAEVFANLSAFTNKIEGHNDEMFYGEERSFKWLLENLVY